MSVNLTGFMDQFTDPRISQVRMDVATLKELRSLIAQRIARIDEKKFGRSDIRANIEGEHGYRNTYSLINDLIKENSHE